LIHPTNFGNNGVWELRVEVNNSSHENIVSVADQVAIPVIDAQDSGIVARRVPGGDGEAADVSIGNTARNSGWEVASRK
jgi:hypothetical protein